MKFLQTYRYDFAVSNKPNPAPHRFYVGQNVKVRLPLGKIVDATIKTVIQSSEGHKYIVAYGRYQTALIHADQIAED